MVMTKEQIKEFEIICKPVIKFINDNFHPHITVIISCDSAELLEGSCAIRTDEYIKD